MNTGLSRFFSFLEFSVIYWLRYNFNIICYILLAIAIILLFLFFFSLLIPPVNLSLSKEICCWNSYSCFFYQFWNRKWFHSNFSFSITLRCSFLSFIFSFIFGDHTSLCLYSFSLSSFSFSFILSFMEKILLRRKKSFVNENRESWKMISSKGIIVKRFCETEEKGIMMKRKIMKERRKRETKNKERKEKIKGKRHELLSNNLSSKK